MALNWHNRVSRWLDRRIPKARQFNLSHKSIFIFPSKFGWLYLLLCLGIFILGTNYQNNLMQLLCFFLIALFLLNLFVAYLNFAKLSVQLGKTNNVYAGEHVQLPLWINQSEQPEQNAQGLLEFGFWKHPPLLATDISTPDNPVKVAWGSQTRGLVVIPRVTISSFYPMGLFRCWTHLGFDTRVLAYPAPVPCSLQLTAQLHSDEPESAVSAQSGYDDFDSLKSYRPGEPLYHVAWKQFAKGQGMHSKQFSTAVSTSGWLQLLPCSADELEQRLGQLCYQVNELTKRGQHFGLDLGSIKIEPDNGPQHQQQCLEALATFDWTSR